MKDDAARFDDITFIRNRERSLRVLFDEQDAQATGAGERCQLSTHRPCPALIFFFDGATIGKDDNFGQIDEDDTSYKESL